MMNAGDPSCLKPHTYFPTKDQRRVVESEATTRIWGLCFFPLKRLDYRKDRGQNEPVGSQREKWESQVG